MIFNLSNHDLLELFNKKVKGHIEAKKALINMINRSKMRHHQKWIEGTPTSELIAPTKCLLIGASGTGKTHLVDTLQYLVKFPIVKIDATRLTLTSASGGIKSSDLEDMIVDNAANLMKTNKGYYHSLEGTVDQTVVFIDEIDKLALGMNESDEWNKRVQSNFLQIIESDKDELAGVSFIFAGAFSGMDRVRETQSGGIGFLAEEKPARGDDVIDNLIVKYGLIPELVGRITSIIELDKLEKEHYNLILDELLLPNKIKELSHFNQYSFKLKDEDRERIIAKAFDSGQGVRYLKRELDKLLLDLEFEYETNPLPLLSNSNEDGMDIEFEYLEMNNG